MISTKEKSKTYEDGRLVIYNASYENMVNEDVKADLIIADPPYNLGIADWDNDFDYEDMLKVFKESIQKDASILIFNTKKNVRKMEVIAENLGLYVQSEIICVKTNPHPNYYRDNGYTEYDKEYILWLSAGDKPYFKLSPSENFHNGIYYYSSNNNKRTKHVCEKSQILIEELLNKHTKIDDVIFDPFAGGGTISFLATKMNRQVYAWETDETYYEKLDYERYFK